MKKDDTVASAILKDIIGHIPVKYDYKTKSPCLFRDPYFEDPTVDRLNAALESEEISMDDLRDYVHKELMDQGKFEVNKRKKDWALPTPETNVLVCYVATWGVVPWGMHTSDTDIGLALRLLDVIIRDLTTQIVPREVGRDFCC